jgi:hypothetical protein
MCWPSGRPSPAVEHHRLDLVLDLDFNRYRYRDRPHTRMFPRDVPEAFSREQGCTEADWMRDLPGAVKGRPLELSPPGTAVVQLSPGQLHLQWQALTPRRIALVTLPRLQVDFRFDGVDAAARSDFMRYFDLFLQRGGG